MNNKEQKIKEMYESIDTPEYDVSNDVLNKINYSNKRYINRRVLIAAAVILSIFLLIGTAGAAGVIKKWKSFDFFGNVTVEEMYDSSLSVTPTPTTPPGYTPSESESETYQDVSNQISDADEKRSSEFLADVEPGQIKICVKNVGGGGSNATGMEFDDISELKEYLENADIYIPIPSYIPKGYSLDEAGIDFYFDEETIPQLVSSEEINNITYRVYKLADGYEKKIGFVSLEYSNKKGNYIHYGADLQLKDSTVEFSGSEDATSKLIEIAGFENCILIHDKNKENGGLNTLALSMKITPVETIDLFNRVIKEVHGTTAFSDIEVYDAIFFYITSDELSEKEIIKIAESIQ